MTVDFLIAGQGLAGTLLALQAAKRGCSFLLADTAHPAAASRVAAGLINPVTGRNLATTWKADTFLPYARSFYEHWEATNGVAVYHRRPMWRIFQKEKERSRFEEHLAGAHPYLEEVPVAALPAALAAPFGAAQVKEAGWLDTATFLDYCRERWKSAGILRQQQITPESLHLLDYGVQWEDVEARHLVWADGFLAEWNPFFPQLPLATTKGELLTLHIPDLPESHILVGNHFVVPIGQQLFRVGATYQWTDKTATPTADARQAMEKGLSAWLQLPWEVVDHRAGVRPTVIDRKPLMGRHHKHPSVWLFNGLGSKGSSQGPLLADLLLDHILNGAPLWPEVDLYRTARAHNAPAG